MTTMALHRLRLRPISPWRTPWQADTVIGALCATAARVHGPEFVRGRLIRPMLDGRPPFVLSDAFPGDLLPVPTASRLADRPEAIPRKSLKRGRWLPEGDFVAVRAGQPLDPDHVRADSDVFQEESRRHNTLARDSDASLEEGGLFARSETLFAATEGGPRYLSLYFRAADDDAVDLLLDLFHELSLSGFGADVGTGRGQFEIHGEPRPSPELDAAPRAANSVIVLSTFQPGPRDPADGYWEAFAKFGKLGPQFGLSDRQTHKHTLIVFRPGACFRCDPQRQFLGRALPMDLVLPGDSASILRDRGVEIIHPAFGLAVPAQMDWNQLDAIG